MIKNGLLTVIVLFFAFFILAVSVVRARTQTSGSNFKVQIVPDIVGAKTGTPTPTLSPSVDYHLPYPGILPDNILYSIKMVRDRILLELTFDQMKKVEKLLLYADKRLGAAKALFEGNKVELGISTLTKGEKYLEQSILEAQKAKKAGKNTDLLYEKLTRATLKHQEVINEILLLVPDQAKQIIKDALQYSRRGYEIIHQ